LNSSFTKAKYELADSLIGESVVEEAAELIRSILQSEPNHAAAYCARGRIDIEEKHYSDAVEHLEHAVRLDPNFLTAYYLLGQTYLKTGNQEQSRQAFERFRVLSDEERDARKSSKKRLVVQGKR
jgi:predicted Zn-dependent protease